MDKYYVYRPMLNLLGISEGTKKGDGYNESLAYGEFTGGDVNLTAMTLKEIDALQAKMLKHPKNKWNSSALGMYQIVRKTRRSIESTLPDQYPKTRLFDADCQDEMACYLLGLRGIDKWLAGRLKQDTLIDNLAKEWASVPNSSGVGHYSGQRAGVTLAQVRQALAEVQRRHKGEQPAKIPDEVPDTVQRKTGFWGWITTAIGGGVTGVSAFADAEWPTIAAFACVAAVGIILLTFIGPRLARSIRDMQKELE